MEIKMKNYKRVLFLATTLCIVSGSITQADRLRVINNVSDQRIQLFIRGEGADAYLMKVIEPGHKKDFKVNSADVQGKNTFEVTASTGNGGNPDWNLMGGTCSTLVSDDSDHILVIDSTLGKLSCKNVTADNPPASGR
jgi:hypothetical protein